MTRFLSFLSVSFIALGAPLSAQMVDAAQIRPILDATKANWVGVRRWDGQDLVYLTHLETWRCGLDALFYGLNGEEPVTQWALAPCDEDSANPMALPDDHLPYFDQPLDSVSSITIKIIYDDGQEDMVTFDRKAVEIP